MFTILLIIISIAVAGYAGYKAGIHYTTKLNRTLSEQNELLRVYALEWANAARNTSQLSGQIADSQLANTNNTLNIVLQLINGLQRDQVQTATKTEQQAIQKIIDDIKGISPNSEFEP